MQGYIEQESVRDGGLLSLTSMQAGLFFSQANLERLETFNNVAHKYAWLHCR